MWNGQRRESTGLFRELADSYAKLDWSTPGWRPKLHNFSSSMEAAANRHGCNRCSKTWRKLSEKTR